LNAISANRVFVAVGDEYILVIINPLLGIPLPMNHRAIRRMMVSMYYDDY
jgi:hypothetical protein